MEKERELKGREEYMLHQEQQLKESKAAMQKEIKAIQSWTLKHLNAAVISRVDQDSDDEEDSQNEETDGETLKQQTTNKKRKSKAKSNELEESGIVLMDPLLMKEFQKLRTVLLTQKTQVRRKFLKQNSKIETMQSELKDAQRLKQEILEDFKRLKDQIKQSEVICSQNDEFKSELHRLLEQNANLKEQLQQLEQELQKFTIEAYNTLYNIRSKFEHNQRINQQLDMGLRYLFTTERYASILELATMIGDISNILLFELKNLDLKDAQYQDLQAQL